MHDPDVVAFDIRRPWPRRDRSYDATEHDCRPKPLPRWRFRGCFWTVAGIGLYWPSLITIWHREPGGHDSGEICKHYERWQVDGQWQHRITRGWKWHVHHWRIQIHPLQSLRRWLLTRCAWCGGPSRRGDYVNVSHGWDTPTGKWWQGAPGRYHRDCSSIASAHKECTCGDPLTEHTGYGRCARCNRFRAFGRSEAQLEPTRLLATIPTGQRDPAKTAEAQRMWETIRAAEEATTP